MNVFTNCRHHKVEGSMLLYNTGYMEPSALTPTKCSLLLKVIKRISPQLVSRKEADIYTREEVSCRYSCNLIGQVVSGIEIVYS